MNSKKILKYLSQFCALVIVFALSALFIRSLVRFQPSADSYLYHLPLAFLRTGMDIPYELNDYLTGYYQGFPFLAEFIQGLLWRLSGSIHATVTVNLIGFFLFLSFCHFKLKANFWFVAMLALTAPMVIIHATTGYVDLFSGSLLAITISSLIYAHFYEKENDRSLLIWAMVGLIGTAWSKMVIFPVCVLLFLFIIGRTIAIFRTTNRDNKNKENRNHTLKFIGIIVASGIIAGIPYFKNIAFYQNPVWPYRVPLELNLNIPYKIDNRPMRDEQRPQPLKELSQPQLFFHSLFEINHPTKYEHRNRWTIDQGLAWLAFRMGGFWNVSVIIFLLSMFIIPFILNRKKAITFAIASLVFLLFVSVMPQSHELRYLIFIPLSWSAAIAIFFKELSNKYVLPACGLLILYLGLFSYMAKENWHYYKIEAKSFYDNAVSQYGVIPDMWKEMQPNREYCAVNLSYISLLLTGPTQREFKIINRKNRELCPENSLIINGEIGGFLPFLENGSDALSNKTYIQMGNYFYRTSDFQKSIEAYQNALEISPNNLNVLNNVCSAYNFLKNWDYAINYCVLALKIKPNFEFAKNNLAFAIQQKQGNNFEKDINALLPLLKNESASIRNDTYLKMGYIYYNASKFEKSIEFFQKSLSIVPNNAEVLNNICASYNHLNRWSMAIITCSLALSIDPHHELAKNNLAYSREHRK